MSVNPEYHPKIIGRRGAVVNGLRKDHDVNIQLPKQGAMEQDVITIKGYEANAEAAKAAILKIVNQYVSPLIVFLLLHTTLIMMTEVFAN